MMYILSILLVSWVKSTVCITGAPGVPIPGADVISQMIAKRFKLEGSFMNYLKNTKSNDSEETEYLEDNLDINIMDMNNFRRLINIGKKQNEKSLRRQMFYKYYHTKKNRLQTAGYKTHVRENPSAYGRFFLLNDFDKFVEKVFHMMKQSIYVARDRIDRTNKMRAYFSENPSYKIALLDSGIHHNLRKMDYLATKIRRHDKQTYFLWYLIIFEKILQCNIDINYAVERIFVINKVYNELRVGMPVIPIGVPDDPSAFQHLFDELSEETKDKLSSDGRPSAAHDPGDGELNDDEMAEAIAASEAAQKGRR